MAWTLTLLLLTVAVTWGCQLQDPPLDCQKVQPVQVTFNGVVVNQCSKSSDDKSKFTEVLGVTYVLAEPSKTYTVVMVDPDAPGHSAGQAWLHWISTGIKGEQLGHGSLQGATTVTSYRPPTPPAGTGIHRYYTYIYEESAPVTSPEMPRAKFILKTFAEEHKLCGPVAMNMFKTQY